MNPLIQPVKALRLAFLECKAEGHQWRHEGTVGSDDPDPGPGLRPPFGGSAVGRRSHCTSCTGERIRWYTRSGEVVNRYRYADGYLHKKADEDDAAPSKLALRQQMVVTLFDQLDGKAARSAARKVKAAS